jgi:NAD(P)-dependent dehydrogenase (short-subunit alcohol dehydrogenase family)
MDMKDKVVAIAGATGGLGPTVVRAFADAGARLALGDRGMDKQIELLRSLDAPADAHFPSAVDLLDEARTKSWAQEIIARYGRVDAVLHLVGGYRGGQSIAEFPSADWDLLYNLLAKTTWHTIRAFGAPLKASKGRFITVSSPQAQRPTGANAAYGAFKAASDALVLALADEFKGSGATANIIVINAILTPQMRTENPGGNYAKHTSAEDIAATMLYLCSEQASAMNGQRIALYGKS